jgi:hypothetical protein
MGIRSLAPSERRHVSQRERSSMMGSPAGERRIRTPRKLPIKGETTSATSQVGRAVVRPEPPRS